YVLAQLAGATIGAFLLRFLFPGDLSRITALGAPMVAGSVTAGTAMGIEAVLTFFLVSAVFGTILYVNAPRVGGFGVGLVLVFDILVGGPLTGAATNPARAFGPSLASGVWVGHAIYWIGPVVGGVIAALLWDLVLMKERPSAGEKVAL
ncbi:MAG: aquaporin, partial [Gemmatimonadales bacterium]